MAEMIPYPPAETRFLSPVATIQQAIQRYALMQEFISKVLRNGVDYGAVPGTDKPTLKKPGAEKACSLFGLAPAFEVVESVMDWIGEQHGGEPFFNLKYRCKLYAGGQLVAEGLGSCNSWEKKYRYRSSERNCPKCGKTTIIKGRAEYGGGWVCHAKRGGCGAKFGEKDPAIVNQQTGQIKNPDPADIVNTIDKMAQKRALVAATLIAANLSDYFTQDMEDFSDALEAEARDVTPAQKAEQPKAQAEAPKGAPQPEPARPSEAQTLEELGYPPEDGEPKANGRTNPAQILIDNGIAENEHNAGRICGLLKLSSTMDAGEILRLGKLYRAWRDATGCNPEQAAAKALEGKEPK